MTIELTSIDPSTCALLVMDYQPSILGGLPDPEPLLKVTGDAIATVREAGGTVGYVRVGFADADFLAFPTFSMMGERIRSAREAMHESAPTTAVHPALAPVEGDIVVRKTRVGAFSTTDLDERLANKGITTLVLAGVHTSGVTLTTVREAHDRDYQVVVLADACADPDPSVHDVLVGTIFPKQGHVIATSELSGLLAASRDE